MAKRSFRTSQQPLLSTLSTIAEHLRSHRDWKDRLQFNEFHQRSEILNGHDVLEPITDLHVLQTQEGLQTYGFIKAGREMVRDALNLVAAEASYHLLRDWLDGLRGKWDQIDRTSHWLVQCLGCDDTVYVRAIGRMFPIAMVARIMKPGCKADYMPVLEGGQGVQKSEVCRVLAGDEAFSDDLPSLERDPVRTSMALRGKWLIEVSEMDSFRGVRMETLKAFVTRRVEHFTPKYARSEVHEPRQGLLIGTQNGRFSYDDPSGARRFWPIEVGEIDVARLAAMREQLFAEAVALFDAGEPWWPEADFEAQHIKPVQEERREIEPWAEMLRPWLGGLQTQKIALSSVWKDCLFGKQTDYNLGVARSLGKAMRECGWDVDHTDNTRPWVRKPIFGPP